MSKNIAIGADELILWLRKNKRATKIPNDGKDGLGMKILDLIENELGGKKILSSEPSYWASLMEDKNIDQFKLPKTSAQYEISSDKIGQLYEQISTW